MAVTLYLLFPEGTPKAAIQAVEKLTVLDCVRMLRAQPVVPGWGPCSAVWLLSLPALSPFLASLGKHLIQAPHVTQSRASSLP